MPGPLRQGQHMPITPPKNGTPPGWIVTCRDCAWAVDAHGETANEAVSSVRANHEPGHFLYAKMVDYTTGYGLDAWGRPALVPGGTDPHPLYGSP